MTRNLHKTSVALLLGAAVYDAADVVVGYVQEFAVTPSADAGLVSTLLLRGKSRVGRAESKTSSIVIPVGEVCFAESGRLRLQPDAQLSFTKPDSDLLLLERDVLDQQIIDVHGHKVVRVNDVCLTWENAPDGDHAPTLRIQEVEIGLRGAVRRLLKGLPSASVERVACHFRSNSIPWEFVDLIDRDPARRVRLKVEQDRLSKMHPSDIADILEDLAPTERSALFKSLDEEVAAEALEEVKPKLQQALIEELDSETIASIVEEMDPGAAADLLSELPEERSDAILEEMDPDERRDVEDLLEFPADSAAGQMTTDYISLTKDATVAEAAESLRTFDGDVDLVTDVYLSNADGRTCGVVPLVQILLAEAGSRLETLPHGHFVCCGPDASGKKVAELFDKYNLRSLPVVDRQMHLVGVIHAEQVIASLRERR